MVERVTLSSGGFEIEVLPERGCAQSRLAWTAPDGTCHELMRRPDDETIENTSLSLSTLSNFVMLPFANRIDGARFTFNGEVFEIPLNRPQQNCAIHGHARDVPWKLVSRLDNALTFEVRFKRDDTPYDFTARQTFKIENGRAGIEAWVRNESAHTLPYGFGYHPWFPMLDDTRLEFKAHHTFTSDDRTFPIEPVAVPPELDFSGNPVIMPMAEVDKHYAGWDSRETLISQPSLGYRLKVSGAEALTNVHIFVPENNSAFCVEPVSHVTDVVNRRDLKTFGDMTPLATGESMAGTMWLEPEVL